MTDEGGGDPRSHTAQRRGPEDAGQAQSGHSLPATQADRGADAGTVEGDTGPRDGREPRRFTRGSDPDYALDGNAIVWERGDRIYLRRAGRTTRVAGNGESPAVSDGGSSRRWAVVFDTRSSITRGDRDRDWDVYMRVFDTERWRGRTKLISAYSRSGRSLRGDSFNGGVTPFAWERGIVAFARNIENRSDVYYRNLNSDKIDDLAHATSDSSRPPIKDLASSARANFIAWSGRGDGSQDVFLKHLIDGEEL